MVTNEKTLDVSFRSIDFESQALLITAPNGHTYNVSLQKSFSDLSQNTNPIADHINFLHGPYTFLENQMETQEASSSTLSTVRLCFSKTTQKNS